VSAAVAHSAGAEAALRKRIDTIKAKAALVAAVVSEITGDDEQPLFVLSKWAMTRAFTVEELGALERTLIAMGAPAA